MDIAYSIAAGVCLAAACGFRVFVPLLMLSGASWLGYYQPAESLSWIASLPALIAFSGATLAEVLGYYVPWVDNVLDAIATPAAMIAGVLASASVLGEVPPGVQWTLAAIAGGGTAGLVQGGTVAARGASTATTGGLGNFLVATLELLGSVVTTILALLAPLLALAVVVVLAVLLGRWWTKHRRQRGRAR